MDVLQWNRDRVSGPLTDNDTHILDTATRQHPSILTGFTLDITLLTDQGIASVQNVLGRSKLEYLHIHCEPLKPHMEHSAGKALQAVQWSTIKSLVIFGSDVDSWIRVWADQGYLLESTVGHQLQSLKVIGTGSVCQRLSHSSALALHGFLYGCVLTDLTLDNVQLRVENDWEFIIGAVDFTLIETISMCNTGIDGTNRQKTLLGEHYTLLTPPTEGVLEGPKGPTSPVAGFNVDKDALAVDAKNSKKGGWVVGPQHKIRYSSPSKWKWDGRRQTYFGVIHAILHLSGAEYKTEYVSREEIAAHREKFPFGHVPVLIEALPDGSTFELGEALAIEHYLAEKYNLLGSTPQESARIKSVATNIYLELADNLFSADAAAKRAEFEREVLPRFTLCHERWLEQNGNNGHYFGDRLTYADLVLLNWLRVMSMVGITIEESSPLKKVEKVLSELPEWKGKYEFYHPFNSLEKEEAAAKGDRGDKADKEDEEVEEDEVGEDEERRKRRRE
ncbi:hypothetical protein BG005_001878 [Podila minutissima]|nr:hypothetical protein BG005_001878 [Podila minutissima]